MHQKIGITIGHSTSQYWSSQQQHSEDGGVYKHQASKQTDCGTASTDMLLLSEGIVDTGMIADIIALALKQTGNIPSKDTFNKLKTVSQVPHHEKESGNNASTTVSPVVQIRIVMGYSVSLIVRKVTRARKVDPPISSIVGVDG